MKWNAGGWFGTQVGATAWILVAAVLAGLRDPATGLMLAGLFVVPNIVGLFFWSRRRSLSVYAALQALLVFVWLSGMLAVYVLDKHDLWESIQTGGVTSTRFAYIAITLVVMILLSMFYLRFGRNSADSA